ncbi:MAG: hypothetical protein K0R99_4307, partial [Microbacterium sp.]|uniref:hypothetical protein n=1 Tax=Microbacterium sp. TaxID=51671 RepID=UPI00260D351B
MNQLNPQHLTTRPFARVERADALPGHCIRCPRNTDLVDLGAPSIQNFGVVYICTVCLGDLMNQMKVVGAEVHQNAVTELRNQNDALQAKLADAIGAKNAPVEYVTEQMREFSDAVDSAARHLVARLGSYSAPRDPG